MAGVRVLPSPLSEALGQNDLVKAFTAPMLGARAVPHGKGCEQLGGEGTPRVSVPETAGRHGGTWDCEGPGRRGSFVLWAPLGSRAGPPHEDGSSFPPAPQGCCVDSAVTCPKRAVNAAPAACTLLFPGRGRSAGSVTLPAQAGMGSVHDVRS